MKITLIIVAILVVGFTLFLFYQGHVSKSGTAVGLHNGKLAACPGKPNCVCSEFPADSDHYVAPLKLTNEQADTVMANIKTALIDMNVSIVQQTPDYLAATYRSAVFGFVDDIEIRLDRDQGLLHLRSASRVGKSDLGANLKRINELKTRLSSLITP